MWRQYWWCFDTTYDQPFSIVSYRSYFKKNAMAIYTFVVFDSKFVFLDHLFT